MEHLRNFLAGIGNLTIFHFPREYPKPQGFAQDAQNLHGDWRRVGEDARVALQKERQSRLVTHE
jgi:hypothetical protein